MRKRQFLTTAAALGLFGYVALGMPSFGQAPPNMASEPLTGAALAADPGTLVVDIRTPGEWADTGVIAGALLVTYDDAESFLRQIAPHLAPGQTLALVCRSGNRTSRAARQIAPLIDNPVVDVAGGMNRILREGYLPVRAAGG